MTILRNLRLIMSTTNKMWDTGLNLFSTYSNKILKCGDINDSLCDKKIIIYGWLHNSRLNGNILLLRDHSGIVQLIYDKKKFDNIPPLESVIKVDGCIKRRPINQINKKMKTGEFEIIVDSLDIINKASKNLPLYIKDHHQSSETTRMKYRYIDLRRLEIQEILRIRSAIELEFCDFLIRKNRFVNVSTPSLFRATHGGAREFVVPTRQPGCFYSLIQSPQQHKQLLMIGGLDRYMQLARCYRNEMSRPDRQPEFTQLDIEMSFVDREHLQTLVEDMLIYALRDYVPNMPNKFNRLSYEEALYRYGSDKPDLRFELPIERFFQSEIDFIGIRVPRSIFLDLGEDEIMRYLEENKIENRVQISSCYESKICKNSEKKDIVSEDFVIQIVDTGNIENYKLLGNIRQFIASKLHSKGKSVYSEKFSFVWIEKFPLFEKENGIFKSLHHQFTSPIKEHFDLLFIDPVKVIGEQFDLVLNGMEIGGGSIRIHDPVVQEYIIKNILKEDVSLFSHLLSALASGAPPHGGFALGNDRLIAILTGCDSIREVQAFPKTADGNDLMSGAPCELSEEQCEYYHLNSTNKNSFTSSA